MPFHILPFRGYILRTIVQYRIGFETQRGCCGAPRWTNIQFDSSEGPVKIIFNQTKIYSIVESIPRGNENNACDRCQAAPTHLDSCQPTTRISQVGPTISQNSNVDYDIVGHIVYLRSRRRLVGGVPTMSIYGNTILVTLVRRQYRRSNIRYRQNIGFGRSNVRYRRLYIVCNIVTSDS